MCGRYYVDMYEENIRVRAILQELNRSSLREQAARVRGGEIAPTQMAPVIVSAANRFTVVPMQWGFPRWGGSGVVINARSEKAEVTPMFSAAARTRRCLLPATAFFEWRRTPAGAKTKEKYCFFAAGAGDGAARGVEGADPALPRFAKDAPLLYLAGLYGSFLGGFAAGGFDGFVILTRDADERMRPIHDRMPVILLGDAEKKRWLSPDVPYRAAMDSFVPPELVAMRAQ